MQDTATPTTLTGLQAAVLRTIVYGDLFDYVLTPAEVLRWLPTPAQQHEVEAALAEAPLTALVSSRDCYVTLCGRESLISVRLRREGSSGVLREPGTRFGRLIGRLPFVRMVALTGSLAVDNADEDDDIDYLIVTAPGRVWFTRAMIMAVGRLAALRGVTLCPNYLLSEVALTLPERDMYTARELLQMQPIAGSPTYFRMLAANAWWRDFLPNANPQGMKETFEDRDAPSLTRRVIEGLLRLQPFDALERWIMRRKAAELRAQCDSPEAVFDESMCKGHFDAWKQQTHRRLEERVEELKRRLQDSVRAQETGDAPPAKKGHGEAIS